LAIRERSKRRLFAERSEALLDTEPEILDSRSQILNSSSPPVEPFFDDPLFSLASQQFDLIADYLQISPSVRGPLFSPKRSIAVSLPVKMDDGSIPVFEGYRVQHHLAMGPTKGGVRFTPTVTMGEVAALAIWMSWKCALTGLPYGGAQGGVRVDPRQLSVAELERVSRRFMQEMIPFVGPKADILGPDMGTDERVMAWLMDTYSAYLGHAEPGIVTGKPVSIGGTTGRREAAGLGVMYLIERAADLLKMKLSGATAVIQGFGNVGSVVAHGLTYRNGMKVIGLGDASGAYYDKAGIDIWRAQSHVLENGDLRNFEGAEQIDPAELLTLPCDVLVPAAIAGVIHGQNAPRLRCRILAEAANGPTTMEGDKVLFERWDDIFVIPDILCNAGGVVVSYFEWVQGLQSFFWTRSEVIDRLFRTMEQAFLTVLRKSKQQKIPHRISALAIAVERVMKARQEFGLFP
jgi:glutamate dehydrogenase (NAD(P)+)